MPKIFSTPTVVYVTNDTQTENLAAKIIYVLKENPKVTQKELGISLGVSIITIKREIKKLVERESYQELEVVEVVIEKSTNYMVCSYIKILIQ